MTFVYILKKIILAGYLNLFFDPSLKASGGTSALKKINFTTCASIWTKKSG